MLDGILKLVKEQVLDAVTKADVPVDKQVATIDTATTTIVDGLKDNLNAGSISSLLSLFGGNSNKEAIASNPLISSIQSSVVSALTEHVGLSPSIAKSVASMAVPAIIGLLSKKSGDSKDSFDLGSFAESISKKSGGLGGLIGGLFGK